jgi:hypothetical protein
MDAIVDTMLGRRAERQDRPAASLPSLPMDFPLQHSTIAEVPSECIGEYWLAQTLA